MADKLPMGGKTVVITGATSGIGLASMVALAREGASIIGVGRNEERCLAAKKLVLKECPQAQVDYLLADLSLQSQVRMLAEDIRSTLNNMGRKWLDVLVNNAGLYSGKLVWTKDGIELTLAVNHIAPFLLTHELLPLLKNAPLGRFSPSARHRITVQG
jgi:NAD(P)-dependent dehydrogenase (short-subunit alcohol dehydrogenase family)